MVIQVEEEINFEELQEQTESLMWDQTNFDIMVGFDQKLTPNIGRLEFNAISYEQGEIAENESLKSGLCDFEHPGVPIIENDLGQIMGETFDMWCPKELESTVLSGNRMQQNYKTVEVNFIRCQSTELFACLTNSEIEEFIQNSRMVIFAPRQVAQLKKHDENIIYQDWIKVYEKQLGMDYYEQNYIEVKLNELVLYDSPFLKALNPTLEQKFLSY